MLLCLAVFQTYCSTMLYLVLIVLFVVVVFAVVSSKPTRIPLMGAHVMVTGGSSGIGLEIAKECARRGSSISIIARNKSKLDEAKSEIEAVVDFKASGRKVICVPLDVSGDPADVKAAIQQAEEQLGPVDFLFNCAGISHAQSFQDTDPDIFGRLIKVNYLGSVYCTQAVLPGMVKRKKGRVVFTSSQAGQLGLFGYSAYSGSKFALRGMAETLQMEVKPHNIAVTMAFPPDTDTPGFHLENEGDLKPEETKLISETSGVHSATSVSKKIIEDSLNGEFMSLIGLEGFLLGNIVSGMSPCNSTMSAIIQGLMMGLFRIVGLSFLKNFDAIVAKCSKKRQTKKEK